MVIANDREYQPERFERLADPFPDHRVFAHDLPVFFAQRRFLIDDLFRNGDLTQVVQVATSLQGL